jgi:hypothetical protein
MKGDEKDIRLLYSQCQSKQHLHDFLEYFFDLDFPSTTISRFSDSNPMDFMWEVYSAMKDRRQLGILALSGRESFKTLCVSIIDLLAMIHFERNTAHLAMTKSQGMRARAYLESFVSKVDPLRNSVIRQNTTQMTLRGASGREVGIEVIPCTPKAVQGCHTSLNSWDEIASSLDPTLVKGYRDSHGILGSSHDGAPGIAVKITSRQTGSSLAEQELKNARRSGLRVVKWTTLDVAKRCEDERSGVEPSPLWINIQKNIVLPEIEYLSQRREGFIKVETTFDKCHECSIVSVCQGDLKNQTSTSPLLRNIDDVIAKVRLANSHDWTLAQIMSLEPSKEGQIYWEFDVATHSPGWLGLWKKLTGKEPEVVIDRGIFVQQLKRQGCQFYAGQDWGWTSPASTIVVAIDKMDNVYVIDNMVKIRHSEPEIAQAINVELMPIYNLQMIAPDVESPGGIHELRKAGLPVVEKVDKKIRKGISLIKGWLRVPSMNNQAKMFFAPDLRRDDKPNSPMKILDEIEAYRFKTNADGEPLDDPEDGQSDHGLDALRYIMMWLFGGEQLKVGTDYTDDKPYVQTQSSNIPSLRQIALQHGLVFDDNREDYAQQQRRAEDGNHGENMGGLLSGWT